MDISPANRPNIFSAILEAVNTGFDGFTDDIENWVGRSNGSTVTLRQANYDAQIDYLNNLTAFLHYNGKLHAPAVGFDWEQYVNQRLNVDFILSMFYSDRTTLADSQCDAFWQENLGIYAGKDAPSASPLIVGLLIHETKNPEPYNAMEGMLAKIDSLLAKYPHPMLYGFFIWIYEYMDDEDWTSWNSWVNDLPDKSIPPTVQPTSSPSPTTTLSPSSSPLLAPEDPPPLLYIAIGIVGTIAAITIVVIFLRMRN
jgi:hypothetical protein